jgi:SPX domain protein involved in polyphosphate accumulation
MENLQHGNLRYDLLLARLQGVQPPNSKNLLFKTLHYISRGNAASSLISPISEEENGQIASVVTVYEQECRRVALFYRSQHQQLWTTLLEVVALLRRKSDHVLNPTAATAEASPSLEKLTTIRALLDALGEKVVALDTFAKANVEAAAELALFGDGKRKKTKKKNENENEPFLLSSPSTSEDMVLQKVIKEYYTVAEAALLGMLCFDPLILGLSDAYALLHSLEQTESESTATATATAAQYPEKHSSSSSSSSFARWVAPQKFKRTTRKFWLKPSDVTRFKAEIIKHLPILVYGNRRKITEIDPSDLPFTVPLVTESDSSPVSSVYLDSLASGLPAYHARLRREDGATAVRLRWYGERDPEDPFQEIFVEKKVHVVGDNATILNSNRLAKNSNNSSSSGGGGDSGKVGAESAQQQQQQQRMEGQSESEKQRVSLPQSQIPALLSGHPVAVPSNFSKEDFDFLQQVQMYILEDSHVPVLRTCYNRTAFQSEEHNRVRISMDTNLRMIRDYIPVQQQTANFKNNSFSSGAGGGSGSGDFSGLGGGQWCRSDAEIANASSTDTVHFPYTVIEVKLQVNPPTWLQNLVQQKILLPVPKFSKFLHGTALLYQHYVENVPHWFLPSTSTSSSSMKGNELPMTPATWDEMITPSAEAVSDAAAWLFPAVPGTDAAEQRQSEEKEARVTQLKPGLLWRWRKGKGKHNESTSSSFSAEAAHSCSLPVSSITPYSAPTSTTASNGINTSTTGTTTPTTATTTAGLPLANDQKHSAPGTPDGASPRAEGGIAVPSSLQNQLQLMMNTDTSGTDSGSGSSPGQRCPASSPTSSASVSSLVSSAEGHHQIASHSIATAAASGGGGINGCIEQQQQQQQSPSSWHVYQQPAVSPQSAALLMPMPVSVAVEGDHHHSAASRDRNQDRDDSSSGVSISSMSGGTGNEASDVETGATASATAKQKPASRKASLVHLVSSIPGLGGLANNNSNNTNTSTSALNTVAPEERKKSAGSVYPATTTTTTALTEIDKKDALPALLPSFSVISSPSSTLPGGNGNGNYQRRNGGDGTSSGPVPRAMVRTRVEPKTFFANERTFLQWLQISVLVMFLGLNLLK